MTWVAVAVAGGAVVGAVGANMAANKQAGGQEAAANTQAGMFNTIVGQEQPFLQGGYGAENNLNFLMNPNNSDQISNYIQSLPGYQFQLKTGGQALTNSMTPGSGALSGATLKSLMSFNQGLAGQYYNNYVSQLLQQAQLGQNAAGNLGTSGTQLGTGIAQAGAAAAGSQAAGIVGETNALSSIPLGMMMMSGNGGGGGGYITQTGGTGSGGGYGGGGGSYSDRRLKEDIKRVGITDGGLPVYTFRFKGEKRTYMGVMADEVLNKIPEAVSKDDNGFYRVNYAMLE